MKKNIFLTMTLLIAGTQLQAVNPITKLRNQITDIQEQLNDIEYQEDVDELRGRLEAKRNELQDQLDNLLVNEK